MGKIIELKIGKYLVDKASFPIREKKDIIILLLETLDMILSGNIVEDDEAKGKIIIKIEKMSRIFFEIENKYFSFNFPFLIEEFEDEEKKYKIYDSNLGIDLNNKIISKILTIFSRDILNTEHLEDFYEELEQIEDDYDRSQPTTNTWSILKKLFSFESGYLRYDYDPKNENGKLHPIHHYDFCFSTGNTFKLGLDNKINIQEFIDMVDTRTECYFLKKI